MLICVLMRSVRRILPLPGNASWHGGGNLRYEGDCTSTLSKKHKLASSMKIQFSCRSIVVVTLLASIWWACAVQPRSAWADEASEVTQTEDQKIASILEALRSLLRSQAEKRSTVEEIKQRLEKAEEIDREAVEQELKAVLEELAQIEVQFQVLATGGAASTFAVRGDRALDLQKEFEQLLQPLVVMLKVATEDSRQIEMLKHERLLASSQLESATDALDGVRTLIAKNTDEELQPNLAELEGRWRQNLQESKDQITSLNRQLDGLLKKRNSQVSRTGAAFTGFVGDRAINLFLGLGTLLGVIIAMQLVMRLIISRVLRVWGRSYRIRLLELFYYVLVIVLSVGAMLYVFNIRNDWLLLALSIIFLFSAGWVFIKILPNLIEQLALFLNLGAVQEGERVVFNGVPWLVRDLNYYTTLENPVLTGGSITLPIRELRGLHSRRVAQKEDWFPCRENEWVKLSDGVSGQVLMQSPELVQLEQFGGAIVTYTTGNFLDLNPVNLSRDFRAEVEFGVDYRHQNIATTEIPETLKSFITDGLLKLVDRSDLRSVNVDFLRAGASSLDYEVEADVSGRAAHLHEDIERALARLLVEACNANGWTIPFPQLTVHRSGA